MKFSFYDKPTFEKVRLMSTSGAGARESEQPACVSAIFCLHIVGTCVKNKNTVGARGSLSLLRFFGGAQLRSLGNFLIVQPGSVVAEMKEVIKDFKSFN